MSNYQKSITISKRTVKLLGNSKNKTSVGLLFREVPQRLRERTD